MPPTRLTDAELELMHLLWDQGPLTARQALAALPSDRERALTTVSTILRILQDKGFVQVQVQGRAHAYAPAVDRASYQRGHVQQVVRDVFHGDAVGLVRQLVQAEALDPDEVAALRALVAELAP
ncbi:BlaI/MecI/CopY family transcriptional regulator [Myxococcota bacterium]|nr:BlaI/MecI/CopY family transcriptional regulator [Myxococcota bacterium]